MKERVLAELDRHPNTTSYRIAKILNCKPEYVRATIIRCGRRLLRTGPGGAYR